MTDRAGTRPPLLLHLLVVLAIAMPVLGMAALVMDMQPSAQLRAPVKATSRPLILAQPKLIRPRTVSGLSSRYESVGYTLESVRAGDPPPAFVLVTLPGDWTKEMPSEVRKSLFFRALLPLVMQVNGEIAAARDRLIALRDHPDMSRRNRVWLNGMAKRYNAIDGKTGEVDWDKLMRRVDLVPPSLALAQGALESGWGRSRFARQGNALFGQWTWTEGAGIVPKGREEGKTHSVRSYRSLLASVRGYMNNLNSAGPYTRMRMAREKSTAAGKPITGRELAAYLDKYSEEGEVYVKKVRSMISVNKLGPLDQLINGR